MSNEKIILGIDPGTTIMGFGLIKVHNKKMELIQMNELNLTKYKDHYLKLKLVFGLSILDASLTIKIEKSAFQSLIWKSIFSKSLKTDFQSL